MVHLRFESENGSSDVDSFFIFRDDPKVLLNVKVWLACIDEGKFERSWLLFIFGGDIKDVVSNF